MNCQSYDYEIHEMWLENAHKRMQEQHDQVVNSFKSFVRQDLAEKFAACVGLALHEEMSEAESIADLMGLTQLDIAALNENFDDYLDILNKQNEDAYVESILD